MAHTIAIALVHGVEIEGSDFATSATAGLRAAFGREIRGRCEGPEVVLEFEQVNWAPVLEERERELMRRLWGEEPKGWLSALREAVARVNRGSEVALLGLVLSGLVPVPRALRRLNYGALR